MLSSANRAATAVLLSSTLAGLYAQQTPPATTMAAAPRLMRIASIFRPASGPPALVESVTLSIYKDDRDPTPLWQETQNVALDAEGRYTVLMGASLSEGMPLALFSAGEPRWLGVQFNRPGEIEQPRVLLVSVPYALKAADADTLGGKPASAYLLSAPETSRNDKGETPSTQTASAVGTRTKKLSAGPDSVNSLSATYNEVDVQFNDTGGVVTGYSVQNLGSGAASYSGMLFYDQNGALGQFQGFNNSTHEYRINNIASGGSINFMIGSTSKFFVANSGNIGIGTTTPGSKLDVAGTATATTLSLPATAANGTTGVLTVGGNRFLHNFANNTFLGTNAGSFLQAGTGGLYNTGIGNSALTNNTGGSYNTATGASALLSNTTGVSNTATGAFALGNNISGGNTANGAFALFNNMTGCCNTATGSSALPNNTTGCCNTATGISALFNNTTGFNNTAFGYLAGVTSTSDNSNTTGSNNTFVGFQSGPGTSTQLSNATAIGANALVTANNTVVLGDPTVSVSIGASSAATKLQVVGDIRVGTSGTNGCVQGFDGTALTGTCSSDVRLKQNIEPFAPVLDKVTQLQPVSYEWKADEHPEYHFGPGRTAGLIAQQVEKLFPEMVAEDQRGYKAVNYSQLPLLLLQAVRELKAENDDLRLEMEAQRRQFQSELDTIKGGMH